MKESVITILKRTTQQREIMVEDILDGDEDSIGYEIAEPTIPKIEQIATTTDVE